MRRTPRLIALALTTTLVVSACGGDDDAAPTTDAPAVIDPPAVTDPPTTDPLEETGTLTVYSGRGEDLVGPIIERFTAETGIEVEVRYGNSAEMLLLIQEEGNNTPADVYYAQGAGFLGTLSADGSLLALDDDILELVSSDLRSPAGDWVGLTGRARTVIYNTDLLTEADVPDSLLDLTDPVWNGRIGWAPSNASLQDHVTALRFLLGEDATREWLEGIMANNPVEFENNRAILTGVGDREVEVGLVNHYYLYGALVENPDLPVANKYYTDGDPGALVNIAGAGILATSDQPSAAAELVRFLLSAEAQEYFSGTNFEIPVVAGVAPPEGVPTIESLILPAFDLNLLLDLQGTIDLMIEVGAL